MLLQDEKPSVAGQRLLNRQRKSEEANVGIELSVESEIPVEVAVAVQIARRQNKRRQIWIRWVLVLHRLRRVDDRSGVSQQHLATNEQHYVILIWRLMAARVRS